MSAKVDKRTEAGWTDDIRDERPKDSVIEFSVRVLRPKASYPYVKPVWESRITAPIGATKKHVESISEAWLKTMEAGLELAQLGSLGSEEGD